MEESFYFHETNNNHYGWLSPSHDPSPALSLSIYKTETVLSWMSRWEAQVQTDYLRSPSRRSGSPYLTLGTSTPFNHVAWVPTALRSRTPIQDSGLLHPLLDTSS